MLEGATRSRHNEIFSLETLLVQKRVIIFHFQMKIRLDFVLVLASLCLAWPARERGEYIRENPSDILEAFIKTLYEDFETLT